jgi:hypothetical protein
VFAGEGSSVLFCSSVSVIMRIAVIVCKCVVAALYNNMFVRADYGLWAFAGCQFIERFAVWVDFMSWSESQLGNELC